MYAHRLKDRGIAERKLLLEFLAACDHSTLQKTAAQVMGAGLVYFSRTHKKFVPIGTMELNTNDTMDAAHIQALRETLGASSIQGDRIIVHISNIEPSPDEHVRQVIMREHLCAAGYTRDAIISVFTAATHPHNRLIGIDSVARQKGAQTLMVRVKNMRWKNLPSAVREEFMEHAKQHLAADFAPGFSVVLRKDGKLATGIDQRLSKSQNAAIPYPDVQSFQKWGDIFATAEVVAMRSAAAKSTSYSSMRLFTTTHNPGPLCIEDAKTSGIAEIIVIKKAPQLVRRILSTQEMPGMSNRKLHEQAARGYNQADTGIAALRVRTERKAEKQFLTDFTRYPELEPHRYSYSRRFTAPLMAHPR